MSQLPEFQPIVTREEFQALAQSVTKRLESFQKLRVEDTDTCQDAFVRAERAVKRADEATALVKKLGDDLNALVTTLAAAWKGQNGPDAFDKLESLAVKSAPVVSQKGSAPVRPLTVTYSSHFQKGDRVVAAGDFGTILEMGDEADALVQYDAGYSQWTSLRYLKPWHQPSVVVTGSQAAAASRRGCGLKARQLERLRAAGYKGPERWGSRQRRETIERLDRGLSYGKRARRPDAA